MRRIILTMSAATALALGAGTLWAEAAVADVQNPSAADPTTPGVDPDPMEPTLTDPTLNPSAPAPDTGMDTESDPGVTTGNDSFSSGSDQEHVVQKGDTLAELAERYLGSADEWRRIAEANDIDDPTKLEIGTRLSIPKDDGDSMQQQGALSGDRS